MGIASVEFVIFIAVSLLLYRLTPAKWSWCVLLLASLVFYVSFGVWGLPVLLGTSLVTWALALGIQAKKDTLEQWLAENKETVDKEKRKAVKAKSVRAQKLLLAVAIVLIIGLLFLFRYYERFAMAINALANTRLWTAENLLLPLGISYYSLQLIGYIVDVQRDIVKAEKNPFKVMLYGIFFLSIMQGPFNRYENLMPQLNQPERRRSAREIKKSLLRILLGFVKKLCIADQVGIFAHIAFANYRELAGLGLLFGIFCFAVQLYADFAGYMDIVIGIGELFGIHLPENFKQPFFARSISEFWQKWHISLGAWLKDYVFYPILKSQLFKKLGKGFTKLWGKEAGRKIPTYLGMLVLWTLIGTWHGAGFTYVFSVGLLQFLYIFLAEITEPVTLRMKRALKYEDRKLGFHIFQSLRVTFLMIFAWIFFNSPTMADACGMLRRIFAGGFGMSQIGRMFPYDTALAGASRIGFLLYVVLCVGFLLLLDVVHEKGISIREKVLAGGYVAEVALFLALFFAIVIFGAYGSQYSANNFIYFEF